jgi:hypothetical protein
MVVPGRIDTHQASAEPDAAVGLLRHFDGRKLG